MALGLEGLRCMATSSVSHEYRESPFINVLAPRPNLYLRRVSFILSPFHQTTESVSQEHSKEQVV
eukprot:scaffold786_cov91-Skeletonema_dohrnii-CCMP3373.AAC.4